MKMIERVARALCAHEGSNPDLIVPSQQRTFHGVGGSVKAVKYEAEPHPLWLHFESAAGAAIEAMRQPTDAMIHAGNEADICAPLTTMSKAVPKNQLVWQAMIDAAQ